VLTVDYDRLGLRAGDRLLDLGCGAGRHAFEALRRGARVTAFDYDEAELKDVAATFRAMDIAGGMPPPGRSATTRGDATRLPFPDRSFDRIIAAEVLEHIPDDDDAIHAPYVDGGHVRIYTSAELRTKLDAAGCAPYASHKAHGVHAPYWWLKCAVGPANDDHRLVRAYHQVLLWDIGGTEPWHRFTRLADRLLTPVAGKSIVIYARKPAAADPPPDPPAGTARRAGRVGAEAVA
jgi:SAM-dependent methyltransferase